MVRLILKASGRVMTTIPRFNRFLESYYLKVVEQSLDTKAGTVDLIVNAHLFGEIKWVTVLAYNFFDSAVLIVHKDS